MANLNTKTISAGVGDILAVDSGIDASTGRQIKDGDGTGSPFYITTTRVGVGEASPDSLLHLKAGNSAPSANTSGTVKIEETGSGVKSMVVFEAVAAFSVLFVKRSLSWIVVKA